MIDNTGTQARSSQNNGYRLPNIHIDNSLKNKKDVVVKSTRG